jgi:hypothetical protein
MNVPNAVLSQAGLGQPMRTSDSSGSGIANSYIPQGLSSGPRLPERKSCNAAASKDRVQTDFVLGRASLSLHRRTPAVHCETKQAKRVSVGALAQLVQQAAILDGDDRLRGEVLASSICLSVNGEQDLLGVHVHRGDHHHPCQNRGAAMDDPVPFVLDNRDT